MQSTSPISDFFFGYENFMIDYIGATIGAHSGPGTVALFYMGDHR